MDWMTTSEASASFFSFKSALYCSRKACAVWGREEAPFSFAIMVQVAKSALALVSARRAIIMSAALIKMASVFATALCGAFKGLKLSVAGDNENRREHITGQRSQYLRNNIKI